MGWTISKICILHSSSFFLFLVINFEVCVPKWYTYKILSITSLDSWIVNTPKEQKQYHKEVLMS